MKRLLPLLLLLAGCATTRAPAPTTAPAPAPSAAPGVVDYDVEALEFPPVRDVVLPEVERVELPTGLVVFLTEDRSLPMVRASARIGMGSLWEPTDHVGLASITAETMRTGGAGDLDPDALNLALENLGAAVEVSASDDATFASMQALAEHVDAVLPLFADVLMRPRFDEARVALARAQRKSVIARRNDDPPGIATRELCKLLSGPESPYARHAEYWTIDAVSRDDVVGFYERYVHPNNTLLAVWGDFNAAAMADEIREAFGAWERAEGFERPAPPPVEAERGRGVA